MKGYSRLPIGPQDKVFGMIWAQGSHYLYCRTCQDMKTISKLDWEQKASLFKVCADSRHLYIVLNIGGRRFLEGSSHY